MGLGVMLEGKDDIVHAPASDCRWTGASRTASHP
jgi:hypothetical protein